MHRALLTGLLTGMAVCSTGFSGVAMAQAPAPQNAEPAVQVTFTPVLTAGQTMNFDGEWLVRVTQSTKDPQGVSSVSQVINSKASIQLTVLEASADGSAKLKATIPTVSLSYQAGDEARGYLHPLPEGAVVTGVAWSGLGERLSRAEVTFTVDATGKVASVTGLDWFVDACREASPDLDLTGLFAPAQFAALVQPIFDVDGSRDSTHGLGTSWEISSTTPLGAVGVLDITNLWRFPLVLDGGVATLVATPTITLRRPTSPVEGAPTIALGNNTGYTRIGWNIEKKKLEARESMLQLTTTYNIGEVSIEHNQTVQTRLVAKD
jgi:hypothetical protein